jgi:hypothetical protein
LAVTWDRDQSWAVFNKSNETDVTIASKLPAARAVFNDLLADEELSSRHERCCALYRRHIAARKQHSETDRQAAPEGDEAA